MRALALIVSGSLLAACSAPGTLWRFDRVDTVGGAAVRVEGAPQLIDTGAGKAITFDGTRDALFVDVHPLAGAATFTAEAIFRPDGGPFEQRWMHLGEVDPKTGADTGTRFLFEIRVVGERWYLDAFAKGDGYAQALITPDKTYPAGRWYRVAMSYDGAMFRSYVDGVMQAEAPIAFKPQGPGHASIGVRLNRVDYFKGAVYEARFTARALKPEEFLPLPAGLNPPAK